MDFPQVIHLASFVFFARVLLGAAIFFLF